MTEHTKGFLLLVVTAALWSTSGVIIKSVEWTPLAIACTRSAFAAAGLAFFNRRHLAWKKPTGAQTAVAVSVALVGSSFVFATKLTTAANAIFLEYAAPIWVALAAPLFLGERTSRRDWIFIAVTFFGMSLFFMDSLSTEGRLGIIVAIFCGMAYACLAMCLRRDREEDRVMGLIYGNILLGLFGLFAWRAPWPSATELLVLAVAGVVQFALPYYLYALASRRVTALEMTLVTTLEPVLNPVWVYVFVGESPGAWGLAGGAVVVASVSLWGVRRVRAGA
ncbi:MAG: DMT family transporter [Desulfovibrio sp.]|jgi:drug/metabolite transporter (DMT)-like permease|nr:DMT family transporter [Desulfovibrio sp.]